MREVDTPPFTALDNAIDSGEIAIVRLLLGKMTKTDFLGETYNSALRIAASAYRNSEIGFRLILKIGTDIRMKSETFNTALQAAAFLCNMGVVRLLLELGAVVNAPNTKYCNALQAAGAAHRDTEILYRNSEAVVQPLLAKGANVNAAGGEYGNALQAAAYRGHGMWWGCFCSTEQKLTHRAESTAMLYKQAAATSSDDDEGTVARLLLQKRADINASGGKHGSTLLAAAASRGRKNL